MEHNDLHLFLAGNLELASVLGERDEEVGEFEIKLPNVDRSLSFMMAPRITSSDVKSSSRQGDLRLHDIGSHVERQTVLE